VTQIILTIIICLLLLGGVGFAYLMRWLRSRP
jgi:hypothetical protein